jgi:hypothetical protein
MSFLACWLEPERIRDQYKNTYKIFLLSYAFSFVTVSHKVEHEMRFKYFYGLGISASRSFKINFSQGQVMPSDYTEFKLE